LDLISRETNGPFGDFFWFPPFDEHSVSTGLIVRKTGKKRIIILSTVNYYQVSCSLQRTENGTNIKTKKPARKNFKKLNQKPVSTVS